jgi:hypothetical protein
MTYPKIILIIGAVLLFLALSVGVGVKLTQKTEGYKAQDDQTFYSFEPHFFIGGCATYRVPTPEDKTPIKRIEKQAKK